MKADFKNIIEIYNNSNDIEKLIFVDVINDLIKGIPKYRKAKKIPQSLYLEDIAKDFEKQMNFQSIKEYSDFMKDLRDFIYKGIDVNDRKSGIFNVNKGTTLIPKNIKEYYHYIGEEEVETIHQNRKTFLRNLEHYGFIEIYVSKNEEYHKICEDFLNEITEIDNRNRRIYLGLSNIKDDFSRKYLERIQTDYGVNSVKKQIEYLFNDAELENYLCKEEDLVKLYEKITGEKIHKDYVEFFPREGIMRYNGNSISFTKDEKPYMMLVKIFQNNDKNIGIDKFDLFKHLEQTDNIQLFYKSSHIVNDTKNSINRRFKTGFKTNKLFLRFKGGALYRDF